MAWSSFFLLSCCSICCVLHAEDVSCDAKQALAHDAPTGDNNALELLQKKSSAMKPEKSEEKDLDYYVKQAGEILGATPKLEEEKVEEKEDEKVEKREAKARYDKTTKVDIEEAVEAEGKAEDVRLTSLIKELNELEKTRARLLDKPQAKSGYTMETIEAEVRAHAKKSSDKESKSAADLKADAPQHAAPADYYKLLEKGKWCDVQGVAQRSMYGVAAKNHTLASCQATCTHDESCNYFSFDSTASWCTTFSICGELTSSPNHFEKKCEGCVTYQKQTEKEHVQDVMATLKEIADRSEHGATKDPSAHLVQPPAPDSSESTEDWQ